MKKILAGVFAVGIAAVLISTAQAATTVAQNFNISSSGATTSLNFPGGQLQCEAQINGPAGSFQATPQFSTDNATWVTASVIGGGLIGQPGVYVGTVPVGPGYQYFRLFFNRISVPMTGQIICGDSLPPVNTGGDATGCTTCLQPFFNADQAPYSAVCDGTTDATTAIQAAITAASTAGGGTVILPIKVCNTASGLTLPANVNLACPKIGPVDGFNGGATPPPGAACTLLVNDLVNPGINMTGNKSSVVNVTFYYPGQQPKTAASPIAYPPTIKTANGLSGANIIQDTFLNSYDAVELHSGRVSILNDNIGAYHYGVNFVSVHDYVNTSNIRLLPYWDIPSDNCGSTIDAWMKTNGSWFIYLNSDATFLSNIQGFCGGTGITLTDDGTGGAGGVTASTGQGVNIMFQSVTTGINAITTHSGPGWQFVNTSVGTLTGGHPITFSSPNPLSCPKVCDPSVTWDGGTVWNPDDTVVDNNPNAAFQIMNVVGITGTLSQVGGAGQNNPTIMPVGIMSAKELTSANISTIGSCWLCFGQTNTTSAGVFSMGNGVAPNHFTAFGATGAHTVQGVTDTVWGLHDASQYDMTIDAAGNIGFLNKVETGGGMQPNSNTGGYSPESFPLGVSATHPQFVTGGCPTIATGGTVCTFPNSFAFATATFKCVIVAQGATPHFFSYDTKTTTGFTAYSDAGTPSIDYTCAI